MPSVSKMVEWALEQCDNPNCGYDMNNRDTYAYYSGSGYYYFDCSSFVCYGLYAGGWDPHSVDNEVGYGYAFNTAKEPNILLGLGWSDLGATPDVVSVGDIGHVYGSERSDSDYGHTEICYQAGTAQTARWMGAHGPRSNMADEVSLNGTKTWKRIFHYYGEDSETGTTGDLPIYDISMQVVAGIAGNWWLESTGINPARWEIGSTQHTWTALKEGYGLGQWTNTDDDNYGRLYKLSRYLSTNGYSYTSGAGQVEFFLFESYWNTYNSWQKFDGFETLDKYLHSDMTDIDQLTRIFCYCWEGISEYNVSWNIQLSERQEYANRAYEYILEHCNDEEIIGWTARNDYLTDSEALNNALLLYRCLMNHANYISTGSGMMDSEFGDYGFDYPYTEPIYGYVDPVTLSYNELLALAFGKLSSEEKAAIISIHKPPKGVK